MKRVELIVYQGRQFLFIDATDCQVNEVLEIIAEVKNLMAHQHKQLMLTLTIVTGARYDSGVTEALKELAKNNKPYVKAAAVVGLTQLQKAILNSVSKYSDRHFEAFDDLQKAKDWLVKQ